MALVSTGACNLDVPGSNPGQAGSLSSWLCIYMYSALKCSKAWSVQCCLRFPHLVNRGLKAQLAYIGIGFRIRSFKTPIAVNENSTYRFFSNLISSGSNSLTEDFKTLVVFQNAKKCVSKHQNRLQLCCNQSWCFETLFYSVCVILSRYKKWHSWLSQVSFRILNGHDKLNNTIHKFNRIS